MESLLWANSLKYTYRLYCSNIDIYTNTAGYIKHSLSLIFYEFISISRGDLSDIKQLPEKDENLNSRGVSEGL